MCIKLCKRNVQNATQVNVPSNLVNDFQGFRRISIEIWNNHIKSYHNGQQIYDLTNEFAAPCVVNFALAIELGLKYILDYEQNFMTGHNLKKLFNKISTTRQNTIKSKVYSMHSTWNVKSKDKNFKAELNQIKDNFIEWRYRFKFNKNVLNPDGSTTMLSSDTSIYFLFCLTEAINEVIVSIAF
jgi:HEPN domain-containing protein